MIREPPTIKADRIQMDLESKHTSYGAITVDTFLGTAAFITSLGKFKMEGARCYLLSKIFSSPQRI